MTTESCSISDMSITSFPYDIWMLLHHQPANVSKEEVQSRLGPRETRDHDLVSPKCESLLRLMQILTTQREDSSLLTLAG